MQSAMQEKRWYDKTLICGVWNARFNNRKVLPDYPIFRTIHSD